MPGPGAVLRGVLTGVLTGVPVLLLRPDPSAGSTRAGAAVPALCVCLQTMQWGKAQALIHYKPKFIHQKKEKLKQPLCILLVKPMKALHVTKKNTGYWLISVYRTVLEEKNVITKKKPQDRVFFSKHNTKRKVVQLWTN